MCKGYLLGIPKHQTLPQIWSKFLRAPRGARKNLDHISPSPHPQPPWGESEG